MRYFCSPRRQRVLSRYRPDGARGRLYARGQFQGEARQARGPVRANCDPAGGCGAPGRNARPRQRQGVSLLEQGLAAWERLGRRTNLDFYICLLAETYFEGRRYEEAMEKADLAIA